MQCHLTTHGGGVLLHLVADADSATSASLGEYETRGKMQFHLSPLRLSCAKTFRHAVSLHTFLHLPPPADEHHAERAGAVSEDGKEGQALGLRSEGLAVQVSADVDAVVVTLGGWQPAAGAISPDILRDVPGHARGGTAAGVPSCGFKVRLCALHISRRSRRRQGHKRRPATDALPCPHIIHISA